MKLLVIVNFYLPDQRVAARRWGGLVPELKRIGVECIVVSAGDGSFWTGTGDAGERIIRLPISNRQATSSEQARSTEKDSMSSIIKSAVRFFAPLFFRNRNIKIWRDALISHPEVTLAAQECDLVVASYGPMAPLLFGRYIASTYNKPLVIDIRDSFQAKEGRAFFFSRRVSRFMERRVLAESCARITIGEKLAHYMAKQYGLSFHAIYNGWSDEDLVLGLEYKREGADKGESPYLYYAGTIYQHRLDALVLVLKALRQNDLRLRIRVLSDNTAKGLLTVVKEHGMEDRVDLLPPVSSTEVAEEMLRSRGVLVLENLDSSELHDGTVTGKLFGLLASGVPGIAVCSPTSEITEVVNKIQSWKAVSNIEECMRTIREIGGTAQHVPDLEALQTYHVAAQAKELRTLITDLLQQVPQACE